MGKHALKKSAGGNEHVVMMAEFNEVAHCRFRHEHKRAAGKLK
jgi:hypothetical protein